MANVNKERGSYALVGLGLGIGLGFIAVLGIGPYAQADLTIGLSLFMLWIGGALAAARARSPISWLLLVVVSAVVFSTTSHAIIALQTGVPTLLAWIAPPLGSSLGLLLLTAPFLLLGGRKGGKGVRS